MPPESSQDFLQAARAVLPPLVGVVFGVFARWSREAREGRVKSLRRLILLDLPTIGALSIIAAAISERLDAGTVTSSSIGVAAGYVGLEVVNSFVAHFLRSNLPQGRG